ncbi:MAG: hypothetical protein ACFB2Z_01425 [Maricaulaceae bacterium]
MTPTPDFESRLFARLPFGFWGGTICIFVVVWGSYCALAMATGAAIVERVAVEAGAPVLRVEGQAWVAFALSLIFTAALAAARYAQIADVRERDALAATLSGGLASADRVFGIGDPTWRKARRRWAAFGIIAGCGYNAVVLAVYRPQIDWGVELWSLIVIPLLYALLARAVAELVREGKALKYALASELIVDSLRPDPLFVYGRLALRGAATWLIFVALGSLFYVGAISVLAASVNVVLALAAATYVFWRPMAPVHRALKAHKTANLARVRAVMAGTTEAALAGDADATARLPGLVALETRFERAAEWPLSTPTMARFAVLALVPVVPWVGSALAEQAVERLAG